MGSEVLFRGIDLSEDRRTQQLTSAKKKLSNFRARGSGSSSQSHLQSQLDFSFPSTVPLTTELNDNRPAIPYRSTLGAGKGKEPGFEELDKNFKMDNHRRQGSMGHRRRPSSISPGQGVPLRTSVTGLFPASTSDSALFANTYAEEGVDLPLFTSTSNIISPSPATPTVTSMEPAEAPEPFTPDNNQDDSARAKFTSFSFGSKPSSSPRPDLSTPVTNLRDRTKTSSPGHSPRPSLSAPGTLNRLSTPLSRPPSLLVTRPTPLVHDFPLGSAPLTNPTPISPPTPARKRHSHTRSNSISMPNLKLGMARPQSHSVLSTSPSFPSSPVSPDTLAPEGSSSKVGGRKLKFEPSGRGAEAEQQREESRRRALEKLTGNRSPTIPPPLEAAVAEISLPDADDEDDASDASTPYMAQAAEMEKSGLHAPFGLLADSPNLSPIVTPSPWTAPASNPPAEQWSYTGNKSGDDHLGLGFGMGMDNAALKRASMPSALGVLTEEDESEGDSSRGDISIEYDTVIPAEVETTQTAAQTPVAPTPSRLRELHLVSSSVHISPSQETPNSLNNRSLSESTPTKPLSRGRRPRPLSGLGHTAFGITSPSASTPTSAGLLNRRRAGSGSKSSISYKRDKEDAGSNSSMGSSREWSFGRITSPTSALGEFGSPPISASAQYATWPRTNAGQEYDHDAVEELSSPLVQSSRWASRPPTAASTSTPGATVDRGSTDRFSSTMSMTESSDYSWRDSRLEMEMERDAYKEDAELWKARCLNAEECLKAEKAETAVLRERVRKLGDRLSSVSSSHLPLSTQPRDDSRPLTEMRDQLFSLMSLVEREQREKQDAVSRVAELEHQLENLRYQPPASAPTAFRPVLPSQAFEQSSYSHMPAPPSPIVTPATPLPSSPVPEIPSPDVNGSRMKSWGFPSTRVKTPPKEKRRESFFGLSSVLRGPAVHEEHTGIDLPPIALPSGTPISTVDQAREHSESPLARSNSMTSSASSVVHFFSGYLGRTRSATIVSDDTATMSRRGVLDLRGGCGCCTGEVFEL